MGIVPRNKRRNNVHPVGCFQSRVSLEMGWKRFTAKAAR